MLTVKSTAGNASSRQEYCLRMKGYSGINRFDSQNVMPIEESPSAVNVSFDGGDLSCIKGYGSVKWTVNSRTVNLLQLPNPVTRLFEFQSDLIDATNQGYKNFYYSDTTGGLYRFVYNSTTNKIEAELIVPSGEDENMPITYFTQYKAGSNNCAILGGVDCGPYVFTEGGTYSLITGMTKPHIRKATMHYGRLFGIGDTSYPHRIWFSKLNAPSDFESSTLGGGYIDISDFIGNTIDVVSYFDTLYVFCRYGIVALDTLSVQSEFSLENVYYSDSEIIPDTVCVCNGKILFATRYGVYAFNGASVKCISRDINGFFDDGTIIVQNEPSIYFKNHYIVSYHKTDGKRGSLSYDFATGKWEIYEGSNIKSIAVFRDTVGEKMLCAFGSSGMLMEYGAGTNLSTSGVISAVWKSPYNDWGDGYSQKRVKEIHFSGSGSGDIELSVQADGETETKQITLSTSEKTYRIPFDISGDKIQITIKNIYGSKFTVSPLTIIYTKERQAATQ